MIGEWIPVFERTPPNAHTTYLCILNNLNFDVRICYYEGIGSFRQYPNVKEHASVAFWLEIPNPVQMMKEKGIEITERKK